MTVWWIWGWVDPPPLIDDESAYLLQAEIFSRGHWTAPARPIPEFFDKIHVFSSPVLASKYPPGHSLLLVPGILLGWPPLVPLTCIGVIGGGLYALARRLSGVPAAVFGWGTWLSSPGVRIIGTTYLSELTTAFIWILGWILLLHWRERGRRAALILFTTLVAVGFITRPFTMLAYALTAAVVIAGVCWKRRTPGDAGLAAVAGAAVLAVIPLWNVKTLGTWSRTPYTEYSRIYFPFDKPGFGVDPAPPRAPLPFGGADYARTYRPVHEAHTLRRLPGIALGRILQVGHNVIGDRPVLVVLLLLGLLALPREGWFALATAGLLLLCYLSMAHPVEWCVYYFETFPVVSFVVGLGTASALNGILKAARSRGAALSPGWGIGLSSAGALLFIALSLPEMYGLRRARRQETADKHALMRYVHSPGLPRAIIFVRNPPDRPFPCDLVENGPDLPGARMWIVHDLGSRDRELADIAPDRLLLSYSPDHHLRRIR